MEHNRATKASQVCSDWKSNSPFSKAREQSPINEDALLYCLTPCNKRTRITLCCLRMYSFLTFEAVVSSVVPQSPGETQISV